MTGPSLTSITCMSAPNTPVCTLAPSSRRASANAVTSGSATGPGAAACQRGATALPGVAVQGELADHQQRRARSAHDFSSRRIRRW